MQKEKNLLAKSNIHQLITELAEFVPHEKTMQAMEDFFFEAAAQWANDDEQLLHLRNLRFDIKKLYALAQRAQHIVEDDSSYK